MSDDSKSITQTVRSGAGWFSIAQIFQRVSQFVVIAALARFLTPADFGIVAMATVFTGFLQVFNDFGIGKAIIQAKELNQIIISSCFWVNLFISISLFLLTILVSPIVADFYSEPAVAPVLNFLGLSFPLLGMSIIHEHLLQRKSDFKRVSISEILASICSIIIAIIVAVLGYGYWALVWRILSLNLIKSLILWFYVPNIAKLVLDLKAIRSIINFSMNLLLFNTINYFSRNIDYILIGKFLGATELGYYSLAYRLMMMPLQSISTVVGKVLYPSLSKIQNDIFRLKLIFLKACRMIAFLSFPIFLILGATSEGFITVFLGEKWLPATLVLQILCLVGLRQSIITFLGNIFLSLAKTKIMMQLGLLGSAVNIVAIIIGLKWGITGVALAYLISTWVILTYPMIKIPFNLIGLTIKELFLDLRPIILISIASALISGSCQNLFFNWIGMPPEISFAVAVLTGIASQFLLSKRFNKKQHNEFFDSILPEKIRELIRREIKND